jgi:hypothetical protein
MKRKITILMMILAAQCALATNLMAATGVREDSSMLMVWAFLCMCALIVIVQLLPALFLTFGLVKSVFSSSKKPVEAEVVGEE